MPQIFADDGFEIVNVVEVNVGNELRVRINVARDGDINQRERTIAPRAHDRLNVLAAQNRFRTTGGTDDDVRFGHRLNTFVETDRPAANFRCQRLCALE